MANLTCEVKLTNTDEFKKIVEILKNVLDTTTCKGTKLYIEQQLDLLLTKEEQNS